MAAVFRTKLKTRQFREMGADLLDTTGREYLVSKSLETAARERCFVYLIPPKGNRLHAGPPWVGAAASETIRFTLNDAQFGDVVVATGVVRECWPRTRGRHCRTGVVLVGDWEWFSEGHFFSETDILRGDGLEDSDVAPLDRSRPAPR